mmetsp:Transcript_8815/g.18788  ORF Transcript_8815/g.18788 Transcript_8815/m.18788 type:complete len:122 (-) Transcript_8815:20-385(-)
MLEANQVTITLQSSSVIDAQRYSCPEDLSKVLKERLDNIWTFPSFHEDAAIARIERVLTCNLCRRDGAIVQKVKMSMRFTGKLMRCLDSKQWVGGSRSRIGTEELISTTGLPTSSFAKRWT